MRELKEYQGSSRALHSYCYYYNNNASSNDDDDDVSLCLRERSDPHEGDQTTLFANKKSESLFVVFLSPSFLLTELLGLDTLK